MNCAPPQVLSAEWHGQFDKTIRSHNSIHAISGGKNEIDDVLSAI